jgi:hypothetical protein
MTAYTNLAGTGRVSLCPYPQELAIILGYDGKEKKEKRETVSGYGRQ